MAAYLHILESYHLKFLAYLLADVRFFLVRNLSFNILEIIQNVFGVAFPFKRFTNLNGRFHDNGKVNRWRDNKKGRRKQMIHVFLYPYLITQEKGFL